MLSFALDDLLFSPEIYAVMTVQHHDARRGQLSLLWYQHERGHTQVGGCLKGQELLDVVALVLYAGSLAASGERAEAHRRDVRRFVPARSPATVADSRTRGAAATAQTSSGRPVPARSWIRLPRFVPVGAAAGCGHERECVPPRAGDPTKRPPIIKPSQNCRREIAICNPSASGPIGDSGRKAQQ